MILFVAVTGRKRSTVGGLIRFVIIITPDFQCPFMNVMHSKFQSHSYWQSLVIALYTNVVIVTATFLFFFLLQMLYWLDLR